MPQCRNGAWDLDILNTSTGIVARVLLWGFEDVFPHMTVIRHVDLGTSQCIVYLRYIHVINKMAWLLC